MIAGIAGILLSSRSGGRPGKYNVWGHDHWHRPCCSGVTGFTLIGAGAWVTPVFDGTVLILAVFISTVVGRRQASYVVAIEPEPEELCSVKRPDSVSAWASLIGGWRS